MNEIQEYPKIMTLFKRGDDRKVLAGDWSMPEFNYLRDLQWEFTEKVDGTNIRVALEAFPESCGDPFHDWFLGIYGRTAESSIPPFLAARLMEMFTADKLKTLWRGRKSCELCGGTGKNSLGGLNGTRCECVVPYPITLYGEGYGARIQKGGGNYIKDGVDFVLFDVRVGGMWLRRTDVYSIAAELEIKHVPVVAKGSLYEAHDLIRNGICSEWGPFTAEGLVARPAIELCDRRGHRIIGKLKEKDF
jgi:hypothetical protein